MSEPEYRLGEEFVLSRSSHGRTEWIKNRAKIALKQIVRNIEKAIDAIEPPQDHTNSSANLTHLENAIIYEVLKRAGIGDVFKVFIGNIRSYEELKSFGGYKPDDRLKLWGKNEILCRISIYGHEFSDEEVRRRTWKFVSTMRSNALGRWDYDSYSLDSGNEIIVILPSLPTRFDLDKDLRERYYRA